MDETESPCDYRCGYVSSGRDLREHIFWEHRPCTECGARTTGRPESLTHRPDCPRLQPGYVYPPVSTLADDFVQDRRADLDPNRGEAAYDDRDEISGY
jgi:hypothetical protein